MDLHEFNVRTLNALDIVDVNDDGYLSRKVGDDFSPWTASGKRVILPTKENLRNPPENTVVYHPLSENITRSESDMIKAMRDQAMYQLTVTAITLLDALADVAATPSEHKKLGPAAGKFLKALPDMDIKTVEFLKNKLLPRIGPQPERRLIHVSLRKGGGSSRDGVLRTATFKFPILEEMLENNTSVMGVKYPSKKMHRTLVALFEIVLGDEETRESFNYGSKNQTAPYFHALMSGFYNITVHFNKLIKDHRKLLGNDQADGMLYDHSWYEAMDDLSTLRKVVPPQEGNEGAIIVKKADEKETNVPKAVAARLVPSDRAPSREEPEPDDLPWESTPRTTTRSRVAEAPKRTGTSLDDLLDRKRDRERGGWGGRDDRDDRWGGRQERSGGWGHGFDRGEQRRYDLGLDRPERRGNGLDDRRRPRRDEPRPFGSGHRSTNRGFF